MCIRDRRKGDPVRITRFRCGQLLCDKIKQTGDPQLIIIHTGCRDAASNPGIGIYFYSIGLNRSKLPFNEQVVDVNLDVLMVERQVVGAGILEAIFRRVFSDLIRLVQSVKEHRPALLEKGKKRLVVGYDFIQGPGLEAAMAFEYLYKPLSQRKWDLHLPVVQTCLLYTSPSPRDRTRS